MIYPKEDYERNDLRPSVLLHATICSKLIQQWNVRHRHHGTWLMSRQSFACALLLLAGRRANVGVISDEQCDESVFASIATLKFWEDEAPDLKASRQILEDVHGQLQMPST